MTNMDLVREILETARRFNMTVSDLQHDASYAESVEEWRSVVTDKAVSK